MTKSKQWTALTAVAAVLIVVAGWFVLISPQRAHVKQLRSDASSQSATNATLSNRIAMLASQEKDNPAKQARIDAIAREIPATPSMPNFIRGVQAAATTAKIDLQSLEPDSPTPFSGTAVAVVPAAAASAGPAVPATADGAQTTSAGKAAPLDSIDVKIVAVGSYFQLQQFVAGLEKLPRATLVSAIDLTPGGAVVTASAAPGSAPDANGYSSYQELTANITVTIFESAMTGATADASPVPASSEQSQ